MIQKPMYPLLCDLREENRFDEALALIHGPDHQAVGQVVVRMESDDTDRPDLLELVERLVLCYNAIPPEAVSTYALRHGHFKAGDLIKAEVATKGCWSVTQHQLMEAERDLDDCLVALDQARADVAISRERLRLLNTILGFTLAAAGTVVVMVTAVTNYLGFFDKAWAFVKGFM